MDEFRLHINDKELRISAPAEESLLFVLRNRLSMTGTKYGCGEGQCGACTVLIDGVARRSCLTSIESVGDAHVTTIEGLAPADGSLAPVQQAFLDEEAFQCGYCTSGMIVSATSLLRQHPEPTDTQITESMDGNICRCGTYRRIVAAIKRASKTETGSRI